MTTQMRRHRRDGFTLIELLTVIGIMCILMAILLPSISVLWKMSKDASTWSEMSSLAAAINNYKATEGTYPGPVREEMLYGFANPPYGTGPMAIGFVSGSAPAGQPSLPSQPTALTSSQNLVLGLLGGLLPSSSPAGIFYDPWQIPRGPYNLNINAPQQIKAYYDLSNKYDLSMDNSGNYTSWTVVNPQNGITSGQFAVPEFMDHYATPRPIIYLRARVGAPQTVDVALAGGSSPQYYSAEMLPYWVSGFRETTTGTFFPTVGTMFPSYYETTSGVTTLPSLWPNSVAFFQNPAMDLTTSPTARGKDAYLLISAGIDGIYGSKDDLIWPRP